MSVFLLNFYVIKFFLKKEWRVSIFDKGLKVNSRRSKLMVGSSGGKMIVNSGKWPCTWSCCLLPRLMGGMGSHSNF